MKSVLSALVLGFATAAASPAAAAPFDGNWSVLIVTEQGNCDRGYRYPITIENGMVRYGGTSGFDVSGKVRSNGTTAVTVSQGNQSAIGTGKLQGKLGRGTWKSPTGGCSGRWTAERRG